MANNIVSNIDYSTFLRQYFQYLYHFAVGSKINNIICLLIKLYFNTFIASIVILLM